MKQLPIISLIVAVLALAASVTFGAISLKGGCCKKDAAVEASDSVARPCNLAYINMDAIYAGYDMANEINTMLNTMNENISADLNKRQNKIEADVADLQRKAEKNLITQSAFSMKQQDLQTQYQNFQNYAAKKQQAFAEESQARLNSIADAISTYVKAYNEEKNFDMIFLTQGELLSAPVCTANAALDITDEVLAGLNEEYIKAKNDKKSE